MNTLGGFVCVRNGSDLDYCWELAAESLLKVCDQVILCDSDSTDGTREAMDRMADREPRIKVINWAWPNPERQSHHWFIDWLNFARQHLTTDFCLYLDADEVLSDAPECHAAIREAMRQHKCLAVDRLNFWRDASSLVPDGECCGKWCVRFGPQKYECVSDEPHHKGERSIVDEAERCPDVKVFHLGFLRRRDAFYRKARVVLNAWFGRFDPRLEAGEAAKKNVWETECEFTDRLTTFQGYMPDAVQRWLSARGHNTPNYLGMNEREQYQRVQIAAPPATGEPMNVLIVGDFGDIIHGMAVFKAIGKIRLFARDANHLCKRIVHRMPTIGPLLLSQDYIASFEEHKDEPIHWNAGAFRSNHELTSSLAAAHYRHYQGQHSLPTIAPQFRLPWITGIKKHPRSKGRIVINRTDRYPNRHFPWKAITAHYGTALMFIGSQQEHQAFCSQFGNVPYEPTENLLQAAELIAGSDLFIGNQSACLAIAEAMKHPRVAEICLHQPDVLVAHDPRMTACADGALNIPPTAGKPALITPPGINSVDYLKNPNSQPKTGWKITYRGKEYKDVSYSTLKRQLQRQHPADTDADLHVAIFDALAAREPSYFFTGKPHAELGHFRQAIQNAL
jgi:glycosyltransferase involved in cell wall biosynthesis